MKPVIINDFSLGMTSDPRASDTRYSQLLRNFDAHTYKHKLVPFKSSEDGDSASATTTLKNFVVALRTGTQYSLYALDRISGANFRPTILYKNLTVSGTDLSDATWTSTANAIGNGGTTTNFNLFVYYAKSGYIYGAIDGAYIWRYDPSGSASFVYNHQALTYTNIAQGLVHSKDDILYIPYDNKIATLNNATWNTTALTAIPAHLKINSICEYGNYIAIGCQPLSGFGKSIVYLWDRDATLNTVSESIDWGEGNLFVLEEIEVYLVGISNVGAGNASSASASHNPRITFRSYSGGKAKIFKEFIGKESASSLSVQLQKQKVNNYLYFFLAMTFPNGVLNEGLWKIGRSPSGEFSVVLDRMPNNDTATVSGTMYGFIIVGDFVFIGYDSSSVHAVSKTKEVTAGSEYTATSVYETVILTDGD